MYCVVPMFGKRFTLFSLLGFKVRIDLSWVILGVLVLWSLAYGLFPFYFPGLSAGTYWLMAVAGVIGLVVSIILHEFSHSIVARHYGLPIGGITLFIFGGVAEMESEPPSAKSEFLMAIAGPLSSFVIAGVFYLLHAAGVSGHWPTPVHSVFYYLMYLNLILAIFNLVPAFPLDGGRMLRAGLWAWRKNLRWATRVASRIGSAFGTVLIAFGLLMLLGGNLVGGVWWVLIGFFVRAAADAGYHQVLTRQMMAGESVSRFMCSEPVAVSPSLSIEEFVNDYVYRYHHKLFPVVRNDHLLGAVTTRSLKGLPRSDWPQRTVGEFVEARSEKNTVAPEMDAMAALTLMSRSGTSRLMVASGERLEGIITLRDFMSYLALRQEFE